MREWRGHTQWRGGTHIEKKCIPHIYKVGVLCLIHTTSGQLNIGNPRGGVKTITKTAN